MGPTAEPMTLATTNSDSKPTRQYEEREKFIITRNVVVIGLAFMIHFTAFHGTSNLQSSVNSDKALGTTTLAVIYFSLILSNIFLPMTVIRWFGCRLTIILAVFTFMPFIAAQLYPRFETLIPAAVMVGLGAGPLWCAKCTYLSTVAEARTHVRNNDTRQDVNTVKYFGLFFIFYQMAEVWGNLISSAVLSFTLIESKTVSSLNDTMDDDEAVVGINVAEMCGARFCPGISAVENPNLNPPTAAQIQLLSSIFLACIAVAAALVLLGVHSLERYGVKRSDAGAGMSSLKMLTVTINLLRKKRQILMLPITIFIGLEEAFLVVDFTQSYVACGWGISNIGFSIICFGIANAIASGISVALVERVGRIALAVVCAVINFALFISMYFYMARDGDYIMYCAFAAVYGVIDGMWLVVVNAFYGILFPDNLIAGYSNFKLWEASGSVIGYVISAYLCTSTKLMILLCVLIVGCIGWFGCRLTMALAFFAYMPYIAAQFYPRFGTLIPAGLMVGLGGGPLWCAKCTYLSTVAEARTHVRHNESSKDVNTVKFFGLFFIFYQMAQVWGNLISSSVLSFTLVESEAPMSLNASIDDMPENIENRVAELCGARFCPGVSAEVNPNLIPPAPEKIQLLNSIFLVCIAAAVTLMILGVHSLERYGIKRREAGDGMSGLKLLTVTINLLRKRRQILMLPITMFIGLEEAFLAVDYTRSFVACGWGISKIGFAMICFGVANAIAAGISGALVEKIGRISLTVVCAVINFTLLVSMYFYEPREGDYLSYCGFAALWGICDGMWLVIVNAFYGILFPKNLIAGYSNFRLWESTGSVIGYVISAYLCTSTKLLILLFVMLVGCAGYGIIEYYVAKKQRALQIMLSDS